MTVCGAELAGGGAGGGAGALAESESGESPRARRL